MSSFKYDKTFTYEGKRYRIRANTAEEFYSKKANKLRDLKENIIIYDSHLPVDIWAERAFDTYKRNVKGLRDMKCRYNKYVSPVIGMKQIGQIRSVECQTILNDCEGMSFSHVSKLRQELSFIFEKAVENQMIPLNPAKRLTLPEYSKGTRRSVTDKEREALYKAYDKDPHYIFFIIMIECGCRPEEVVNLIGKDIDHEGRLFHVRGTKTKNADRYVPISDSLYQAVKNIKPFDPVATNKHGNKHTESSLKRLTAHLKRDMNIAMGCKVYRNQLIPPFPLAEDFVPYCLRHTFCTDLCRAGVDVRTAQKLMGHANISITADIYTHVDLKDVKNAGKLLRAYREG